jgi:hypothetical protein
MPKLNFESLTLEQRIDQMGQLKAQIATLEKEYDKLKSSVIEDVGVGAHEGETFRVSISVSSRETLDMEAVRNHLSPQFIRAHTRVTESTTVRVTARKGD